MGFGNSIYNHYAHWDGIWLQWIYLSATHGESETSLWQNKNCVPLDALKVTAYLHRCQCRGVFNCLSFNIWFLVYIIIYDFYRIGGVDSLIHLTSDMKNSVEILLARCIEGQVNSSYFPLSCITIFFVIAWCPGLLEQLIILHGYI